MGATIAKEVIDVIKSEKLIDRANKIGALIQKRIIDIKEKYGVIKEVRGRGLMIAIEFQGNPKVSFAQYVNDKLLERNIILVKRPGYEVFRIDPALTIDIKDVEFFLNTFEEIISKIQSKE